MERLTPQEEKAMRGIWEVGPCAIRDLLKQYPDPKPPYTTVASVVKNLARKKYVRARQIGNVYEYRAVVDQSEYMRMCANGMVSNFFGNSYKNLVTFFAKNEKISADELREIVDMIEKGEGNEEEKNETK